MKQKNSRISTNFHDYFSLEKEREPERRMDLWFEPAEKDGFVKIPDILCWSDNRFLIATYLTMQYMRTSNGIVRTSINDIIARMGQKPRTIKDRPRDCNVGLVKDALETLAFLGLLFPSRKYASIAPSQMFITRINHPDNYAAVLAQRLEQMEQDDSKNFVSDLKQTKYTTDHFVAIYDDDVYNYPRFVTTQQKITPAHRLRFPEYIRYLAIIRRSLFNNLEETDITVRERQVQTILLETLAYRLCLSEERTKQLLEALQKAEVILYKHETGSNGKEYIVLKNWTKKFAEHWDSSSIRQIYKKRQKAEEKGKGIGIQRPYSSASAEAEDVEQPEVVESVGA